MRSTITLTHPLAVFARPALALLTLACTLGTAGAQGVIYRCGNEYTNLASATEAKARGCKAITSSNVTVVEGTRVSGAAAPRSAAPPSVGVPNAAGLAAASAPRVAAEDQRARDTNARAILEGELRRTEARLADLRREYNGGEPEKLGPETRNHQKYLDRVADLKANIGRAEDDIAGIQRELARHPSR